MTHFEVQHCLESMEILVDTREQDTERARARYAAFPCPYRKQALSFGDYAYNVRLPDGAALLEASPHEVIPLAAVERKMSLDELAVCFTTGRKRFEAEMQRAREAGAPLYLLVEDATWEKLLKGTYRSQLRPQAYLASILAWQIRYPLRLLMCRPESTPILIYESLKRELKEKLETGYFDGWEGKADDKRRNQSPLQHV